MRNTMAKPLTENRESVNRAKGGIHSAAVESKGYIKIDLAFWKGARVTVLKPLDEA